MSKFLDAAGLTKVVKTLKKWCNEKFLLSSLLSKGSGDNSLQMNSCNAKGVGSFAEGLFSNANGDYSHAEGSNSNANGNCSHSEGENTSASGNSSHSEGADTIANGFASHAQGAYNKPSKHTIHQIGIGSGGHSRKNAEEIYCNLSGDSVVDNENNGCKYLIGLGGYDGTNLFTDSNGTQLNKKVKSVQEVIKTIQENIDKFPFDYVQFDEENIKLYLATSLDLDGNDFSCVDIYASRIIKNDGTSNQLLVADGSVLNANTLARKIDTIEYMEFKVGADSGTMNIYKVSQPKPYVVFFDGATTSSAGLMTASDKTKLNSTATKPMVCNGSLPADIGHYSHLVVINTGGGHGDINLSGGTYEDGDIVEVLPLGSGCSASFSGYIFYGSEQKHSVGISSSVGSARFIYYNGAFYCTNSVQEGSGGFSIV